MIYRFELPFVVKVCGITREQDADCAISAGANALGLNFYAKSPRRLTLSRANAIASQVPENVLKVGIFVNASAYELRAAVKHVPLDVVQLHGRIEDVECGVPAWRAISFTALEPASPLFEAYVMDSPSPAYGGSGQSFDWKLASRLRARVVLAGGLDGSNVAQAIETARPWGVDACSRLESRPGEKDPARVRAFVEAAIAALRITQERKGHGCAPPESTGPRQPLGRRARHRARFARVPQEISL